MSNQLGREFAELRATTSSPLVVLSDDTSSLGKSQRVAAAAVADGMTTS